MEINKIPNIPKVSLSKKQISRKNELLNEEVKQIKLENTNITELLESFADSSFEARNIGEAARLYHNKLQADNAIIWTSSFQYLTLVRLTSMVGPLVES